MKMDKAQVESLLTLADVCARLNVSHKVVRRLIRQGKLRAVRLGKTNPLRFREMDLRICIEECATLAPDTQCPTLHTQPQSPPC
jgi:excisionase family DNA binding protein